MFNLHDSSPSEILFYINDMMEQIQYKMADYKSEPHPLDKAAIASMTSEFALDITCAFKALTKANMNEYTKGL